MPQPRRLALMAAAAIALCGPAARAQDVQTGIGAWQQGDYPRAVAAWRPLAEAGNADAQFNLGQAYRLGRGVPQDVAQAEHWFELAARQRHEQAGASLGLLLFQNGRAREAMPWIQAAAMRGDPRTQYVFGTALFNGDIVRRDLPRAYAMMSVAAAQGFPQARTQLAEMERQLSAEDQARGRQIAAEMNNGAPVQVATAEPGPRPRSTPTPPQQNEGGPPRTRADRPNAGVSYAPPPADGAAMAPERVHAAPPSHSEPPRRVVEERPAPPRRIVEEHPAPRRVADNHVTPPRRVTRTPTPTPAASAGGRWRVQLGAFADPGNARRRWDSVRQRVSAVGGLRPAFVHAGALTRVQAGPFASRAAAERACAAVRSAGSECILVTP
jgi:uncharacterized protein